jgi:hypothetical protein
MCEWVPCRPIMTIEGHSVQILGVIGLLGFYHGLMVPLRAIMSYGVTPRFLRAHGAYPRADSAWVRFMSPGAAT